MARETTTQTQANLPQLSDQIAAEVVKQTMGYTGAGVLVLVVVYFAVKKWFGSYWSESGKLQAISDQQDQIIRQLEQAERTRSRVLDEFTKSKEERDTLTELARWERDQTANRELIDLNLMRERFEHAFVASFDVEQWCNVRRTEAMNAKVSTEVGPTGRILVLMRLYFFADLTTANNVALAVARNTAWSIEMARLQLKYNHMEKRQQRSPTDAELRARMEAVDKAIDEHFGKADALIAEVMNALGALREYLVVTYLPKLAAVQAVGSTSLPHDPRFGAHAAHAISSPAAQMPHTGD